MKLLSTIRSYSFQLWHLLMLFLVIAAFQIFLTYIHNASTTELQAQTLDLYRRDSAERIADLTTASLEFLLEQGFSRPPRQDEELRSLEQKFNIILSQQILQKNIEQVFIIYDQDGYAHIISNGMDLMAVAFGSGELPDKINPVEQQVLNLYKQEADNIRKSEQIFSYLEGEQTFHILVPFFPQGEYSGVVYMRIAPDFSDIAQQISTTYNEIAALFSALILLGLLAMFYISSFTVKERDDAQKQLYAVRERQMRKQIEHEKEAQFTQRIYHTHHKAEKIMGFIKEDLRVLAAENLESIRDRVSKYANFISRVIYDMKASDPPIQVIRNPLFRSDLNTIIQFIVDQIFRRVYREGESQRYELDLDPMLPKVPINEYVIWGILEPLIQNALDHNSDRSIVISITSEYNTAARQSIIRIADNGKGIRGDLLDLSSKRCKKLFLEHTTSKEEGHNSGYGCYIAFENCKRCGWKLDVENLPDGGARFVITINN